jgi:hypothetical protein
LGALLSATLLDPATRRPLPAPADAELAALVITESEEFSEDAWVDAALAVRRRFGV